MRESAVAEEFGSPQPGEYTITLGTYRLVVRFQNKALDRTIARTIICISVEVE